MKEEMKKVWGYLRETTEKAKKAGKDLDTGLERTGLNEYLSIIFPKVNDWIHDKPICEGSRKRPDYRSETLKLIVEFDGLQHYNNPLNIKRDKETTEFYESLGYKVVRIPYFIQLTNKAVETFFGVKVEEKLFDENFYSLGINSKATPAFLCPVGIIKMAEEFIKFPEQYQVNIKYLKSINDEYLTGVSFLEFHYNLIVGN